MNSYIIQLLFGITLLLVAVPMISLLLRKRSAALRHAVAASALVGTLLLPLFIPFFSQCSLGWNRNLRPQPPASRDLWSRSESKAIPMLETTPGTAVRSSVVLPTAQFAFLAWGIISAILLIPLGTSVISAKRLLAKTQPLDDDMLGPLAERLGIRRTISLRKSEVGVVPFTVGVFCPVIVLPESADDWTPQERRAILTHELGHIARLDVFWQLLAEFCCVVYWFHPLVWLTARRLRIEREAACDDLVVLTGEAPPVYASVLLRVATKLKECANSRTVLGCSVAMTRRHEVRRRVAAILNPKLLRKPLSRLEACVLCFATVLGISIALIFSPFKANAQEKECPTETVTETPQAPKAHEKQVVDAWEALGIRFTPIPKGEWKEMPTNVVDSYPHGGIRVTEVRTDCLFGKKGIKPGDIIVGINEWVTTSENDIRYIAKHGQSLFRVEIIRNETPYYVNIDNPASPAPGEVSLYRSTMVESVRLFHQGARGEKLREKIGKDASDGYLKALADDLFAAKHGEIAAEVVRLIRDKTTRDRVMREMRRGRR